MHINKCNCLNFAEDIVKIQLVKQSKVSMMVSVCFIRAYGALLHVTRILNIDLPKKSWSDFLSFIPAIFLFFIWSLFFLVQYSKRLCLRRTLGFSLLVHFLSILQIFDPNAEDVIVFL